MARQWTQASIIDQAGKLTWDTSTGYRATLIEFANAIQDDIASKLPQSFFKFRLKKLLPVTQSVCDLNIQVPSTPTVAIASGGSLTDGSSYKVYVTFVIYDPDLRTYMESEPSTASAAVTGTAVNKTINITGLDTMDGDTSVTPATIYRNIYVSELASGETSYGEPFYYATISDNTTTSTTVTAEPSSTVTPPSYSEVYSMSEDAPFFNESSVVLKKQSMNEVRKSSVQNNTATSPYIYDLIGVDRILLYPQLSSTATTAQRTISYHVYRRPHEFFYSTDRNVDLPIIFREALLQGIVYRAYFQRDRDGKVTEFQKYEAARDEAIRRVTRNFGEPTSVVDTLGDTDGWSI